MTQQNSWKKNIAIGGILLIVGGLLFLLQHLGILRGFAALVWTAFFGAAGLFFLYLFLKDLASTWWAAIPGCTLLGLSATVFLGGIGPRFLLPASGPLFLFSMGILVGTPFIGAFGYLWPLVLIVGGAFFIWRNLTPKASE